MAQGFTATAISMKLDEDNFLQWKDQAFSTIEGNWKRQDALLKSWLLASMSKSFTTRMVSCIYTHQVWKRLEDHFASQIKAKVMQPKHKLSTLQIGASVTDYVLLIKVYTSILPRAQSITVAELEALLLAHESMLSRFRKPEAFVQANIAQFERRGSFRGRGGRMSRGGRGAFNGGRSSQESWTQEQSNNGQFQAGRGQFNRGGRMQNTRDRPQCQLCNKLGHTARTCWYRYSEEFYEGDYGHEGYSRDGNNSGYSNQVSQQISQPHANFSNVLATPATVQDPSWYPDSGASHHMTHNEQNLLENEECCGNEQVIVGNGTGFQISFVGNSCIKSDLSSRILYLKKLLCCIKTKDTQQLVLQGIVHQGLYEFPVLQSSPEVFTASIRNKDDLLTWHARLGHPNHSVVSKVLMPHVHQQNGAAERKHRHVVEMRLTLLAGASMPTKFWSEAFTTTTKLINMLPTPVLDGLSPMEKLFGKKPSYEQLRVFGCLCFSHHRAYNKHKLDFRSSPCTFIGYGTSHKGYKCLTQDGRVIITPHVVFFEDQFPFKQATDHTHSNNASPTAPLIPTIPRLTSLRPESAPREAALNQHLASHTFSQSNSTVPQQPIDTPSTNSLVRTELPTVSSANPTSIPINDIEILLPMPMDPDPVHPLQQSILTQ
ncbi:Retrovirus-related Pol polyprotein [Arachis hypogaea]|nr:Retrovirus-related Pol polyprotein [Arachis hypogaea]